MPTQHVAGTNGAKKGRRFSSRAVMAEKEPAVVGLPLTEKDRNYLADAAIEPEFLADCRSATDRNHLPESLRQFAWGLPGILFPHRSIDGRIEWQLRGEEIPKDGDKPEKGKGGYRFAKGMVPILGVMAGHDDRVKDPSVVLVIAEGPKQSRAFASALVRAGINYAVVSLAGCRGYTKNGKPIRCLDAIPLEGRRVLLLPDGDIHTKPAVRKGFSGLKAALEEKGATAQFLIQKENGNGGVDDALADLDPKERGAWAAQLLTTATDELPPCASGTGDGAPFTVVLGQALDAELAGNTNLSMAHRAELKGRFRVSDQSLDREMIRLHINRKIPKVGQADEGVNLASITRLRHRMEGWAILGDLGLLYGAYGTGKTLMVVAKAVALARGEAFLDQEEPPKPGRSLIIATDAGAAALKKAFIDLGIDPDSDPLLNGPDRMIWVWAHAPEQGHTAWVMDMKGIVRLEEFIRRKDIAYVGIDSAKSVSSGAGWSYVDNEAVKLYLTYLRAAVAYSTGAFIEIVSHDGRDIGAHSGAKAWAEEPSMVISLTRIEDPDKKDIVGVEAHVRKDRGAPANQQRRVRYTLEDDRFVLMPETETVGNCEDAVLEVLWDAYCNGAESLVREQMFRDVSARFDRSRKTVENSVARLTQDRPLRVIKPKRGLYALAPAEIERRSRNDDGPGGYLRARRGVKGPDPNGRSGSGNTPTVSTGGSSGVSEGGGNAPASPDQEHRGVWVGEPKTTGTEGKCNKYPPTNHIPPPTRARGGEDPAPGAPDAHDPAPSPGETEREQGSEAAAHTPEKHVKPKRTRKAAAKAPAFPTEAELGPLPAEPLVDPADPSLLLVDLETCSAGQLWQSPNGAGPFVRLVGTQHGVSTDPAAVAEHVRSGGTIVAHNGFGFDFLALARHHGVDLLAAAEGGQLVDTMVLALAVRYPDPPKNRKVESWSGGEILRKMSLDALAQELGHPGKVDDLKKLAQRAAVAAEIEGTPTELAEAGYGLIPRNLPEFVAYLRGDIEATQAILRELVPTGTLLPYLQREMRVMGRLVTGITLTGIRVDVELCRARYQEVEDRKEECRQRLVRVYGLPTHTSTGAVAKNPLSCAGGPEAIDRAAVDVGLALPRTEKTGKPSTGKVVLGPLLEQARNAGRQDQVDLLETVLALTGARSVYQTALESLQPDGRVHPSVVPLQASGRFSITNPGMTVFGKRGERVNERAIFLPDSEEEVLLAGDLSQVDMRAMAAHAQDPGYLELFEPGRDAHAEIAAAVGLTREAAKAIGHGWNYGMSVNGMVAHGIDRRLAEKFDRGMTRRFPILCKWREKVRARAERGLLLNNGFGRMMKPNPSRAHTQGPALMGQGTARDLMMEAVLRLPLWLVPRLRILVHDELVFSVRADQVDGAKAAILDAMTFEWAPPGAHRAVKITGELSKLGSNWAECYAKE